jgi:hypothetical protein
MKSDEAFQKAKETYLQLREKLAAGLITSEQFKAALRELMVEHNGKYWSIGARNGKWHVYEGNRWIEQEPPVRPDSLPEEQLPLQQPEIPAEVRPTSKSCPKCGAVPPDNAKFCRNCGATLPSDTIETPGTGRVPESIQPPPPRPIASSSGGPSVSRETVQKKITSPPIVTDQGLKFVWHRDAKGQFRSGEPAPTAVSTSSQAAISSTVAAPGTTVFAGFGKEQVNLSPASPIWGFRLPMTAFADKLVKGLGPQNQGKPNPFIECLARIIRGALMHKDVYRTAASNGSLTTEAICVAAALIVISTVGLNVGTLLGYGSSFLVKAMIARAAGWIGAVIAIHFVAKQWQQLALPPVVWFRGLIYAQSAMALSIVPSLGGLASIWGAICTVAALQDVSGKDIKVSITLLLVAGLAVVIMAYGIGSLQF